VKYWEDFEVGETSEMGSHRITEAEILAFARKYDPQPFHTDEAAARASIYGGLIASGWHTCGVMMRLSVEANQRERAAATGSPGLDSCRWLKPVRPDDVLTGRTEVLETWPSRTKPIGFVRRRIELRNQRGEIAVAIVGITMYRRRPAVEEGAS
jgi:acyl dehydratase